MALYLMNMLNSNTIANKFRDSLLFILPLTLLANVIITILSLVTGNPASGTYDGSVLYMYYELFLATFGARNIETD